MPGTGHHQGGWAGDSVLHKKDRKPGMIMPNIQITNDLFDVRQKIDHNKPPKKRGKSLTKLPLLIFFFLQKGTEA